MPEAPQPEELVRDMNVDVLKSASLSHKPVLDGFVASSLRCGCVDGTVPCCCVVDCLTLCNVLWTTEVQVLSHDPANDGPAAISYRTRPGETIAELGNAFALCTLQLCGTHVHAYFSVGCCRFCVFFIFACTLFSSARCRAVQSCLVDFTSLKLCTKYNVRHEH